MKNSKVIPLKNGESAVIRRAVDSDADGYTSVSIACYGETRFLSRCAEDKQITSEQMLPYIQELADSQKEALFVADYNGQIVGFGDITACLGKKKMRHKCDLNLSVLRAQWHLGIGSALMEMLIDFAREAGYEQIDLSVADDNARAIRLYERFGFQHTGRNIHAMKHADGDYSDFLLMTKFLLPNDSDCQGHKDE